MASRKGTIVLMGSGELGATMVAVHKELLARFGPAPRAVFLDTPAGFQLDVDRISRRAVEYFRLRVRRPLLVASFKSSQVPSPEGAEKAFQRLRDADYILIGPGSPTYAVRHLRATPVPQILVKKVQEGGCLVAGGTAAPTVGRMTLPVHEIYTVGHDLHWIDGLDILAPFGFDLAVVPHWNNAEGASHDTRFCFMGKPRFEKLAAMLPKEVSILGIEEHTACIIDLEERQARIAGSGRAVLHRRAGKKVFDTGERFPIEILQERAGAPHRSASCPPMVERASAEAAETRPPFLWDSVQRWRASFMEGLERRDPKTLVNALLELDRTIWQAHLDREGEEAVAQSRKVLRDLIVLIGPALEVGPPVSAAGIAPLVEELLRLRATFRHNAQREAAAAVRTALLQSGVIIEECGQEARWRLSGASPAGG
ncbi:MAG: hypothetical protein WAM73_05640 [Desulfobacterales bacterium]